MTLSATEIRAFVTSGMTAEQILLVAETIERNGLSVTRRDGAPMSAAERARKYRQTQKSKLVTTERENVTVITESVTVEVTPPAEQKGFDKERFPTPLKEITSKKVSSSEVRLPISDVAEAVADWNTLAAEIPLAAVQKLTESRRQKLAARLRDCGGIDGWRVCLDKIRASPFLRGETSSWAADFDFVVKEANFIKIMEGKYDDRAPKGTNPSGNSRSRNSDLIAAVIREAELREDAEGSGGLFGVDERTA